MFDIVIDSMHVVRHIKVLESTHKEAIGWLNEQRPPEGSAIRADFQTSGIGRFNRTWRSEQGQNLLASFIFYPGFIPPAEAFVLNMAASLAVCDCLETNGLSDVQIKWPNDVLVGSKKMAGILIHNQLSGQQIKGSVISIGLNVNQTSFSEPVSHATSMRIIHGESYSVETVFGQLHELLHSYYENIKYFKDRLRAAYLNQLLGRHEDARFITSHGEGILARIENIGPDGSLTLVSADGLQAFGLHELRQSYDASNGDHDW